MQKEWQDENGKTIFSDKPPPGNAAEEIQIRNAADNDNAERIKSIEEKLSESRQARLDAQAERQKARAAREEAEETAAKEVAEAAERQQKCDTYRARLETFRKRIKSVISSKPKALCSKIPRLGQRGRPTRS